MKADIGINVEGERRQKCRGAAKSEADNYQRNYVSMALARRNLASDARERRNAPELIDKRHMKVDEGMKPYRRR